MLQIKPVIRHVLIAEPHGISPRKTRELDDARLDEVELDDGGAPTGAGFFQDTAGTEGHGGKEE